MKDFVHIIPSDSTTFSLKKSFELRNAPQPKIITLTDDLRVGPLNDINTEAGSLARRKWWERITENSDDHKKVKAYYNDLYKLKEIKSIVEENNTICIWYGTCAFDQLMLARLIYYLKPAANSIFIVPISEHTFTNIRREEFTPESTVVLNPVNMAELFPFLRQISNAEIKKATELWKSAEAMNSSLREINEGILEKHPANYYDSLLLTYCTNEFQTSAWVIGMTMIEASFTVNDIFLNWRLKELVKMRKLEYQGILKDIRDYKIKIA